MALKIIGVGWARTGTLSLKKALEKLGFGPCYHMYEIRSDFSRLDDWVDAFDGKPDWDKIYEGFNSTTDFPGFYFYKELIEKYPDAKVILTVRDPDAWYESVKNTVQQHTHSRPKWAAIVFPVVRKLEYIVRIGVDEGLFKGKFEDKQHTIQLFSEHIEEVKRHVPEDKLLVFNVMDGWEKLCDFLDVSIPDESFPKSNDTKELKKLSRNMFLMYRSIEIGVLILIFGSAIYLFT